MAFDLSTAKPVGGFDLSTAHAVDSQQQTPFSFSEFAKNLGSAAIRPVANAVTALPLMAMDAGVGARNLITGSDYELPSSMYKTVLDSYTRAPTTTAGSVAEFGSSILAGGLLGGILPQASPKFKASDQLAPGNFAPPNALTGAQQKALSAGEALGMKATPGQETGSVGLQQFEAKLQSQPWTSGPFNKLAQSNQEAQNATAATAIGQSGKSVDASVLEAANDKLGQIFENARSANRIIMANPEDTKSALDQIDANFEGLLPGGSVRSNALVVRLEKTTADGAINGEQLGSLSSKLGRLAYKNMTTASGDRDLGQAIYEVKNHVDDLLQSTLSGDEAAQYGAARQQYRALMQLTSRVGNVNPSTGNVGGGSLANYLQQTDKRGFTFGGNQSGMYNAARFSQAFKPVVGNSGTATRSALGVKDALMSIPGGALSRLYLSGIGRSLAGSIAGAPAAQAPDAYLGVLNAIPQIGLAGNSR